MLVTPVKAKASMAVDPRWLTSMLLRALARLAPKAGAQFTSPMLAAELPDLTAVRLQRGITKLLGLGFIAYKRQLVGGVVVSQYITTSDGAAAFAAAAQGAMLMPGRHMPRPAAPGSLRARLWQLLRIRKVLDADEAIQLLADAGDPRFASKRGWANTYLRRWHQAGVLQLSNQVGPWGRKRYVLATDPGPAVPPFITPIAAAQAKAAP